MLHVLPEHYVEQQRGVFLCKMLVFEYENDSLAQIGWSRYLFTVTRVVAHPDEPAKNAGSFFNGAVHPVIYLLVVSRNTSYRDIFTAYTPFASVGSSRLRKRGASVPADPWLR